MAMNVILVDDHPAVQGSLRDWLGDELGAAVVGMAGTEVEAFELIAQARPELVVSELELEGRSNIALLELIPELAPEARLVVFTRSRDAGRLQEAIAAGASGMVCKTSDRDTFIEAVRRVLAGEVWIDPAFGEELQQELTQRAERLTSAVAADLAKLTRRERVIMTAVAEGLPSEAIARRLGLSENTVRHHLTHIYRKLGLANRTQLAIFARECGLHESRPD